MSVSRLWCGDYSVAHARNDVDNSNDIVFLMINKKVLGSGKCIYFRNTRTTCKTYGENEKSIFPFTLSSLALMQIFK